MDEPLQQETGYTALGSRPFLVGVDDDDEARRIIDSETPQGFLHSKLLSDPVEQCPMGYVVRRMEDARAITKNRAVPQTPPGFIELLGPNPLIPIMYDGPDHARWRKVLDPVFAPKKVAPLEAKIRERADALVDEVIDRGEADFYEAFCEPLPSSIFLDLMGIPQTELPHFLKFKDVVLPSSKFMPTLEEQMQANADCDTWFNEEFERRARLGVDSDDLLTWLSHVEVDGRPIARDELLSICRMLMIGGLDTVGGTLACDIAWLARHPGERRRLVEDPSLWPMAIEELLRWESPVQGQGGFATEDVKLPNGEVIPKDSVISVYISAANLDPEVFDDPLTVKLDRSPNPHISFASGFHRCLGSHLARMELRVALEQLHARIPDYWIPEGVELSYWGAVRAPRPLPLVWH